MSSREIIFHGLGWFAFALNVWGNLALANKSTAGWIVRLASNAAWLIYSAFVFAWPLFINHATFVIINVHGWRKWAREDRLKPKLEMLR
jgi:hypothetical protein